MSRASWLMMIGVALGLALPASGQQVIHGERGQAVQRAVVNFKAVADFEQIYGKGRARLKTNDGPMPLPTVNQPPAVGGSFQAAGSQGGGVLTAAAVSSLPSPSPTSSFQALDDAGFVIPPDTHGAVGPNHLMVTLNTQVRIQDRNGANLRTVTLDGFWQSVGAPNAFDPKVLYDPFAHRWMFTAMADARSSRSSVLMGVSQSDDPTGNWFLFRIDADRNDLDWADYPSMGFNKDWIVVSVNMFPIGSSAVGFGGVKLFVFDKAGLYANGSGSFTVLQDATTAGFTICPALTYDNTLPVIHLVEVDNLFQNFSGNSSRLRLSTISGSVGSEVLTLGTAFSTSVDPWRSSQVLSQGGSAPQLGSPALISQNDSRIQNVVFRNGSLWCAHTVFLPAASPTHAAVQWWQLSTTGGSLQFGRIEDQLGLTNYSFPSIAVNRNEDALIGFSRFSGSQFASANYAFRGCSDPINTFRADSVLKAGEASYSKDFGGSRNRWGDYSSTVVDPVNDLDLWTLQEYASTPTNFVFGSQVFFFDRWGTWWGRITPTGGCQRVEFASPEYTVNEATPGFARISLFNLGGGAGSVDFTTSDGTAVSSVDYLARSGTITFAPGQTETNFVVIILDNAVVNSNKTINLTLSNPTGGAVLGNVTNAVVTIIDDETIAAASFAGEFNFSSYLNDGQFYLASEFETSIFPCGNSPYTIINAPDRSAPGVLVTVIRTNGSSGRVLVDYETAENGQAVPFLDYTPVSGTLVFDDHQMSTNFLVEVFPDDLLNPLGIRFIRLVLSNPRPAPEEEAQSPGSIRPKLGPGSESGILLYTVSVDALSVDTNTPSGFVTNAFAFERHNWRFDEYEVQNQVGGYRLLNVQIINPSGTPGNVRLRTRQFDPTPPTFGNDEGWYGVPPSWLQAGSDFAEAPFPFNFQGVSVWRQPFFTDPALTTITNVSDYFATNVDLSFAANECRKNVTLILTNDPTVELNEDIILILEPLGDRPVHSIGFWAGVTILHNDQPAGALDREWNLYNLPASDPPNNQTPGANGPVRTLAVQPDGKTILGGDFDHVNAVRRPGIARIGTNGAVDHVFDPGVGVDGFVTSVLLYSSNSPSFGRVLVAGQFSSYNGAQRNGIARVLSNGQIDPTFAPGNGANGTIWSIALQTDGRIIVGGGFTEFNNVPRNGLARLNPDGTLDLTFDIGAGPEGTVYAVGVAPDNAGLGQNVFAGGDFFFFNGEFNAGVVRLTPTGGLDANFRTGAGVGGVVNCLAVQTNGTVVVAGFFSQVDGRLRGNIARLNADGSLDEGFDPGTGTDDQIMTVTLDQYEKAIIGGPFTSFDGTRRVGLARLRQNGTLDTSFMDTAYNQFAGVVKAFNFEPPNYIAAIALQPDGKVMVGGSFTNIGGNPSLKSPLRNDWTVFTRADKQIRFNIARLIGGATPGPGNAEFESGQYFADENGVTASVQLRRTDGRLGRIASIGAIEGGAATPNVDYVSTNLLGTWQQGQQEGDDVRAPVGVGAVSDVFFSIPLLDDTLQEGDETLGLDFVRPEGSLTLGGEYIPLGGAFGRSKSELIIGDNDFNRGIFNFSSPTYVTNEATITARVNVIRTNGSAGLVTVRYFSRPGTNTPLATANVDYRPVSGTLTFGSGETNKPVFIEILDDTVVEFDESFELVLTNATGGARLPGGKSTSIATATFSIIDNDYAPGRLNFAAPVFTTNENAGFATIAVTRTGGSLGVVSVQYATADGSALNGQDYTTTTGTVSWNDGESGVRTFTIPLTLDGIVDNDTNRFESVALRLFNPRAGTVSNPALLGTRTNATLLIEDSDAYGTLSFNQPFYQADENGGVATVIVSRRNGLAGTVSVNITTTPTDALSPGTDYVSTNATLTFLPGESSKSFNITLLDDTESDGNKDVILTLSSPVLASLGTPNPVVLTLIDNESFNIPAGELDTTFSTNAQFNGPIYSLALQPDGRILAAGDFTEVNNVLRAGLVRLSSEGLLDNTLDVGEGANGSVRAMLLQPDGKVVVGGFFTQFNSTNRPSLIRLLTDGTVDSFFNAGAGGNSAVLALALQADDKILAGGSFSTFNSVTRPGLVRLNTNGTVDLAFSIGAGADGAVFAIAVQDDGKILVGGDFVTFNSQVRTRLVRLNRNGSIDSSFNPALALNGAVRAILVQPDGKIVVGGSFTSANGVSRNSLARFHTDGTLDATFLAAPLAGADSAVFALARQVDGKLIVAGDFRTFNGVTRSRITRLNADGTTDPTINFGAGANAFVAALAIQPDRKILLGGDFTTFDGRPRQRIARIHGGSVAGPGQLEFEKAEFVVDENVTNAVVTVRRRFGTTGAVGVNYQTVDGTAVAPGNYAATSGTATFVTGETRFSFTVPIVDNQVANADLFLGLELLDNTFTGGATNGPTPVARVVIIDNESSIGFTSPDFAVGENVASGLATITVQRSGGTNLPASVSFATGVGSATPQVDYVPTNGVLTFVPGETLKSFHVRILNDSSIEPIETIPLQLSNASGSNVLSLPAATLHLQDDDFAPGQFIFSSATYQVTEASTNVLLTVLRTNGYTGVVSVRYRTTDNTAAAGADYVATNNILAFADGESAKTIQVSILDDLLVEPTENFNVVLSAATGGASVGSLSNATVTINDNDVSLIIPAGSSLISESLTVNGLIDPGEAVTLALSLRNVGTGNTSNLVATLLAGNGVTLSSGPQVQSYGALAANGLLATRPFTFTAVGNVGDRLVATLLLTDGGVTNGFATFAFTLGGQASRNFSNTNRITINDNAPASPYPSVINVASMGGTITKVTVTVTNLTHSFPDDIDMLLVGPSGEKVMLLSDAGSTASAPHPINNVTLTFDASAATTLSDSNQIVSGTYRPVNYAGLGSADAFPAPAPPIPYTNTSLAVFNGTIPNGNWSLYIVDDTGGDAGSLGGWSLVIQTSDPVSAAAAFSVADLGVTTRLTPNPAVLGANYSSVITITNKGPATANSVAMLQTLSAGVGFVSASPSAGTWSKVGNTLTWTVGDLPSGGSAAITVVSTPLSVGTFANPLTVSANQFDPNLADNTAAASVQVVAIPALKVTRVQGAVVLSWPADSGFKLQSTDAIQSGTWGDVGVTPQVLNGENVVTQGAAGSVKFYRLRTP